MKILKTLSFPKLPLIYLALAVFVGLCITHKLYVGLLIYVIFIFKCQRQILLLIGITLLTTGYTSYRWHNVPSFEITEPMSVVVTEVINQEPQKTRFIAKTKGVHFYVSTDAKLKKPLGAGNVLLLEGKLTRPTSPSVPHAFDFKTYLQSKSVSYTMWAESVTAVGHQFEISQLQERALSWVHQTFPAQTARYMSALFLGADQFVDEDVMTEAKALGVLHLFAISGLHITLLAQILSNLLKRTGLMRDIRNAILISCLAFFVILTGGSASVIRASGMMIVSLLSKQFNWKLTRFDIFSVVFITHVLLAPNQVRGLGFIYSYTLTFFLIGGQVKGWLLLPLYMMLATLPIQFATQGEWNILTFAANLCFIPLMTYFIMPSLLLVLVVPPFAFLSDAMLHSFEWLIHMLNQITVLMIRPGILPPTLCFLLAVGFMYATASFNGNQNKKCYAITVSLMICGLCLFNQLKPPKLTMLDVGQGDSFIFQDRTCHMMIDTGGKISFGEASDSQFDYTLEPYLRGEGIQTLDYVFLTHGDHDHIGEAIPLITHFNVKHLVISEAGLSPALEEVINLAKQHDISILAAQKGDQLSCGSFEIEFLHPSGKAANVNDGSLVMTVISNGIKTLMTGDSSSEVEKQLDVGPVHIYKAGHHGSASSNDPTFMASVSPQLGLVSAGANNRYGHPSVELVEWFEAANVPLYNTVRDGTVEIQFFRPNVRIKTYPKK